MIDRRRADEKSIAIAVHPVEIDSWGVVASQKLRCYNGIMNKQSLERLTDVQLISILKAAVAHERAATARLIALLAEMDIRRLYLAEGYSSLFVYCVQCLRLSEHAAYGRIEAARAARKFPIILEFIDGGSITLTTVRLLAPHLTVENYQQVLAGARFKTKREVEQQVAALSPEPSVPSVVRKLPLAARKCDPMPAETSTCARELSTNPPPESQPEARATEVAQASRPRPAAVIAPLAAERYKVQITIGRETHDKLRRTQDLLRHAVPNGDPAVIFDRALSLLLKDLVRRKLATVDRPRAPASARSHSRHVPAAVKREVWGRDQGQCAFIGTTGRCTERGFLELHHVIPFADGGASTVDNLQLRCPAHNAYEAREHFSPMLFRERSGVYELGPDRVDVTA